MESKIQIEGRSASLNSPSIDNSDTNGSIIDERSPLLSQGYSQMHPKIIHDANYTQIILPKSFVYDKNKVEKKKRPKKVLSPASFLANRPQHIFHSSREPSPLIKPQRVVAKSPSNTLFKVPEFHLDDTPPTVESDGAPK